MDLRNKELATSNTFQNASHNSKSTSIVEMRKIEAEQAKNLPNPGMKRSVFVSKLICSFFGEFLARCFLFSLCGVSIWRLTMSFVNFPSWGYVLLSLGIILSLIDCLQSSWYRSKLYGYWHFYKYIHWSGRTWLDPNTLFCLFTIIPALACTELAIYNMRYSSVSPTITYPEVTFPFDTNFTQTSADHIGNETASSNRSRRQIDDASTPFLSNAMVTSSHPLVTSNPTYVSTIVRISTTSQKEQTTDWTTTIETTSSSHSSVISSFDNNTNNSNATSHTNATGNLTSTIQPTPTYTEREFSLYLIHHLTCLIVVFVRLQIRRPEGLQRIRLNQILFELLLNAVDLNNLIIYGLNEIAVVENYGLFVAVMCCWGVGFFPLLLLVSRRYEIEEFETDRRKLETFYCVIILLIQDLPRLILRLYIIIQTYMISYSYLHTNNMLFFVGKNCLTILLYAHRMFVLWDVCNI